MIVRSIVVENFRPFLGDQRIEFSNGVNIINAQQGGGKTSLFSAFYWCLFDKIYNSTEKEWVEKPNIQTLFNKQAFIKSNNNDNIKCQVKLEIEKKSTDNKTEKVTICRRVTGTKNKDAFINVQEDLEVLFFDEQGAITKTDKEAAVFIDQYIFPESLSDYIWFQGEFINKLIDLDSSDSFKKVIDTISYIDYYDKLISLINVAQSKNQGSKARKLRLNKDNEKDKDNEKNVKK